MRKQNREGYGGTKEVLDVRFSQRFGAICYGPYVWDKVIREPQTVARSCPGCRFAGVWNS